MKTRTLIVIAAVIGLFGAAHAEGSKEERRPHKLPSEIIEKFDTDGDGKLNEEERAAAKDAHKKEILEKFDTDGDGELNAEEKKAAHEARKKRLLERFDKDGDGELNDEERAEIPKRPGGKGPRPGKGGGEAEAPGIHE
jgi:Ca2+-binding EF-hand superfamily protein